MTDALSTAVQSLEPGALVELFELDLSPIGVNEIWRFTPTPGVDGQCVFAGQVYYAADVEASGFEVNGQGQIPQPRLRVSNATLMLAGLVLQHDDVIGAKVRRTRILAQYLDDGAEADPDAIFPVDQYVVEQKVVQDRTEIEWKLSAETDQQGVMLPKRTVVRDYCPWTYRVWSPSLGAFDYSDAECPYTGADCFKADGTVTTTVTEDECGRKLTDCTTRFGTDVDLPFGGFPGVGLNKPSEG